MRALALTLALFAFPVMAANDEEAARITTDFCANASSTVDYNACSMSELQQADADMQNAFGAVLEKWKDTPETVIALRDAQIQWESFQRAAVTARFAALDAAIERGEYVGSAYTAEHNWYEARLARTRTALLCDFLRGPAYGE